MFTLLPKSHKVSALWVAPLCGLVLAALACSVPAAADGLLLKDDFSDSDSGWADSNTDPEATFGYRDGEYVIQVHKAQWIAWTNPDPVETFTNFRAEITVKDTGGSQEAPLFGLMCHYQDEQNYYYAGFGSDGYYALLKSENGDDTVLAGDDISSDIAPGAESYKLTLECANGQLILSVNDQPIAQASDSTFTTGQLGIFVLTFKDPSADIHFDDLRVFEVK